MRNRPRQALIATCNIQHDHAGEWALAFRAVVLGVDGIVFWAFTDNRGRETDFVDLNAAAGKIVLCLHLIRERVRVESVPVGDAALIAKRLKTDGTAFFLCR